MITACDNCTFFVPPPPNFGTGMCRRNPEYVIHYPSDWCGEYVQRLASPKESTGGDTVVS